jgi:hypothetical protein
VKLDGIIDGQAVPGDADSTGEGGGERGEQGLRRGIPASCNTSDADSDPYFGWRGVGRADGAIRL